MTLGTVPAGEVWVIRDITAWHGYPAAHYLRLAVVRLPGGFTYLTSVKVPDEQGGHLELRQVLTAGEQLQIQTVTIQMHVFVTGYVFVEP